MLDSFTDIPEFVSATPLLTKGIVTSNLQMGELGKGERFGLDSV